MPKRNSEPHTTIFTEIGDSPAPGLTLRQILRGHTAPVSRITWSPNGLYLGSADRGGEIKIWDTTTAETVKKIGAGARARTDLSWSPSGQEIAVIIEHGLAVYDARTGNLVWKIEYDRELNGIAWSPTEVLVATGSPDGVVRLWDATTGKQVGELIDHRGDVYELAWSPDGSLLASGGGSSGGKEYHQPYSDCGIRIWDTHHRQLKHKLAGHTQYVADIAWSPDSSKLASVSMDTTVRVWDTTLGKQIANLEAHTSETRGVAFSPDGYAIVSHSWDHTLRFWVTDSLDLLLTVHLRPTREQVWDRVAFSPDGKQLAISRGPDVYLWDTDLSALRQDGIASDSIHYTTAKLVLVGDTGVGKTGLGWRLAHGEFKEHISTHGQQFWTVPQLQLKRADGTECEAVLWDLAGQHVYRQVHSIFLENITAALVLFDPSNRQEPLKGVHFWIEQLKGNGQLPPAVLVGARVDRGTPTLPQQELEQFCQRYGIRGGYISTSAASGEGLETLLKQLKTQIPWDEMSATVTTVTFKHIKDYVLALKEKPDREGVLVRPTNLREQLQSTNQDWHFTDAEMMTAVGHLETHGYVAVLRSSAGEQYILLAPDLLATLASSIVLLADKNPRELGAVSETELLQGKHPFTELAGLSPAESQTLLDAAILRFLQHNICFRETLGDETLLIFPGLIKQKRPLRDDLSATDDTSYVVRGQVENLFASLVVLLGYTPSFTRINQWQNQAQYEMGEGEICGFRLIEDREGEIELLLYYGERMPVSGRTKFQELFEQFLYQRNVEVTPFPPVICPGGHRQERATIIKRVREGKRFVFCEECGEKTKLSDLSNPQTIGIGVSPWLQREEAAARLRSAYEVQLTKVKGYRREWASPRCYVSHLPAQGEWSDKFVHDLRDAGVYVVESTAQVQPDDFVVVLDTPAYQKAFNTAALSADVPLVRARLGKRQLISIVLTGQIAPHEFRDCTHGDFSDVTHYPVSLFDLVLNLYAIPLTHAGFAPLRQALHEQWEETLARKNGDDMTSPLKVFVSYSHKDEAFKDELVTMLASLQRRGIVDTWHDRLIEAGDEWYQSIEDAMNDCDLALLLISPDYLASRFIQEEEQPRLLRRREEMQLRVVPVIVRPCTWQSEPVLKNLQALPKDGKAVISFSRENGERDQIWTDIAIVIEKRAKAKMNP